MLHLILGLFQADIREEDWMDNLHPNLKESINRAIEQLDQGKGRSHQEVMREIKTKVSFSGI